MWLGPFAEFLGIRPWEIDRLTVAEFNAMITWLNQRSEQGQGQ